MEELCTRMCLKLFSFSLLLALGIQAKRNRMVYWMINDKQKAEWGGPRDNCTDNW